MCPRTNPDSPRLHFEARRLHYQTTCEKFAGGLFYWVYDDFESLTSRKNERKCCQIDLIVIW